MSVPVRRPKRRLPRWLRRSGRLLVVLVILAAAALFYGHRHLEDAVLALARRAAPEWRISLDGAAFASAHRLELRGLSLKSRDGKSELLHLDRATIDFSIAGLRQHHIDALIVDDPVLRVDDAALQQFTGGAAPAQKQEATGAWTVGTCTIRGGKARVDLSHQPLVEFEFASEPQARLHHLALTQIAITGRDRSAPSRAEIKSVEMRFAMEEIVRGHLRELIVRDPSVHLTAEVMTFLPHESAGKSTAPDLRVDRLLIEHGDLEMRGLGAFVPDAALKFGLDTTDVRMGDGAEKLHHVQLWEIALWPRSSRAQPFFSTDSVQVDLTLAGLLARKELAGLIVTGMTLQVGEEFRSMMAAAPSPATAPATPNGKPWLIRNLEIHGSHVAIADLGVEIPSLQFDLNTKLNDVPLSPDIRFASTEMQKVEFADLTLHSPLDPFVPVVNFKTVFVNFSFAQIARHEIDALVLLNPTIFVGPDLFWYVDRLKKRQAEAAPSIPAAAPAEHDAGWQLKKFEAAYGQLVIAAPGQAHIPLPLSFATHAENIRFSNFSDLQLQLNLLIPTADYPYPAYELEFKQLGGEIKFGLPPGKQANNLVQTLRSSAVRWKQFTGEKLFWAVTYDEKGIYGQFGGAGYGGYVTGQFSFFLQPGSPWQGWISGSGVDLGRLTNVIAPENFHMTGPVDFKMTVKALSTEIEHVEGKFSTRRPGRLKIGKLDDLLANIPPEWNGLKQGATRIGLETLRDFDYDSGHGDFSFAGKKGKLALRLRGSHGSRNFDIVVH